MATQFRMPSNQAISNQVVSRDGTVNYAPISTNAYSQQSGDAFNQVYANAADYQKLLADVTTQMERNSPLAQADVYSRKKLADAEYLKARAMLDGGNGSGLTMGSGGRGLMSTQSANSMQAPTSSPYATMLANEQERKSQIPIGFGSSGDDAVFRRISERNANEATRLYGKTKMYDAAAGQAQRDLDKYIAQLGSGDKRYAADTDKEIAKTQQPLTADQVLEKTRIENPYENTAKGMAMNLLGGYASGQNARSNFAYWG
jgi:hypothetical protein